ncbi:MAG TPA: alpha/beta fold hydrolase [Holophagaceae bacterium]|jgi:pimeloyl-ACP methyl ester carboxylesterase|nr:alpha/beta fold hydrolase [Holophagaceae bacterium]
MSEQPALPFKLRALQLGFRALRGLSQDLTFRGAERLFCTPKRHRIPEAERPITRTGHSFELVSGGLKVRGYAWGEGPRVVLLHGWEGRGSQLHAFVRPLMDAGFSVLALDAPGHGRSEGRTSGPLDFARALETLTREAGPIHAVVAHSLGSVATTFALDEGLRLSRLVLISPPATPSHFYTALLAMLGFPENAFQPALDAFAARIGFDWGRVDLKTVATRMRVPMLLIHDRGDRETPWEEGAAVAQAWPGAELVSTEGLGHRRILKDEAVVAKAVAFLRISAPAEVPAGRLQDFGPRSLEQHLFRRDLRFA